jgi:N-acetylglucosaminyldiphosphoundecaprenol N-acetyl-beta-D-mannosaminyltransferase
MERTLEEISLLVARDRPSYFITANLNYAMLCDREPRLRRINAAAAFILADGKPIVWATRFSKRKLPERVAGADLIPLLCAAAAEKGYRLFFLGGEPGTAENAARIMREKYPALQIVGVECPPHRALTPEEHQSLIERLRQSQAQILLLAYGQPKGEFWLEDHLASTGIPVAVQIGGTFDFISGRTARAPKWMQKVGLEWLFRWIQEPGRLARRYLSNIFFVLKAIAKGLFGLNYRG